MTDQKLDVALRGLAEVQHGLVGRLQARQLGADRQDLQNRLQSPDWEVITDRVLRLVGSAETFQQHCMAAVLDAGPTSVGSHQTAAALWRIPGFPPGDVHVSRPRGRTSRPSSVATVHQPRFLPGDHVATVEGIPVTTVARTLFDLAGAVHPGRAARALDNALARGLTTMPALHAITAEMAQHGRGGSTLMRELLAERAHAYRPPESGLEARFLDLLRSAALPLPEPQRDLGGERWVGRVDFLYSELRLVVELDSSIHHSTVLDRAADARRDRELVEAGFRVYRIRDADVWHRPDRVVAGVRAALGGQAA